MTASALDTTDFDAYVLFMIVFWINELKFVPAC